MSNYDRLFGEMPRTDFETISGGFGCQVCSECVDEARYYGDKQLLVWTCPAGHTSKIEKFNLG